ncbi:MAG: Caspase protein [Burkholderia sp.]|jgi:hypothetical protein|nr:Caspase protein [Burkholderia sp.]
MTTATLDQDKITKAVSDLIATHKDQKGFTQDSTMAAAAFGSMLLAGVQQAYVIKPTLALPKGVVEAPDITPSDLANKDFWSFASSVVRFGVPIITSVLGKDFKQPTAEDIFAAAPSSLTNDKDFWDFLSSALNTVVPAVVDAINGKDFQVDTLPAVPEGKEKGWFDDVMSVVAKVAPLVIAAVL